MLDGLRYVKIYTVMLFKQYFDNVTENYPLKGRYPIVHVGEQTATRVKASKFHHETIVSQTVHIYNNDLNKEGDLANKLLLIQSHFDNIDVSNIEVTGFNRDVMVDETTELHLQHHIIEIEFKIR